MGVISRYRLDETTENLGNDSHGNKDLNNTDVVSVSDTYGLCGYFNGSSSKMTLPSGSVPTSMKYNNLRSYSCWFKGSGGAIHSNGGSGSTNHRYMAFVTGGGLLKLDLKGITVTGTTVLDPNTWYHYASVYNGSTLVIYLDGVLEASRNITYLNTFSGAFGLGWDQTRSTLYFTGFLSDYRSWSNAISASQVANIYSEGPLDAFTPTIEATLYPQVGALTWNTVHGASTNIISQIKDGGAEETIVSGTTDLSFTATGITPGSSYVFNLYTDLDLVTPAATSNSKTAPAISNSTISSMADYLENDFTILSEADYDTIEHLIRLIFSTGDTVTLSNGDNLFVEDSEEILILPGRSYLTPFETTASSGQEITLINADGSGTNLVEYNESTDQVVVGSTTYAENDSVILGHYRIVIKKV
jgi:hypothetical protein